MIKAISTRIVRRQSQWVRATALLWTGILTAFGCHRQPPIDYRGNSDAPTVRLIQPPVRNIVRIVSQPSFIESYERTSIYPKLTGYIEKWIVDIGDKVKKGDALATLFVPELVEDHRTKVATVAFDIGRIKVAKKGVDVADADVKAATARVAEVKADVARLEAEVKRWLVEVERLTREVATQAVDAQVLAESKSQLESATAARDQAVAIVATAAADLTAREAVAARARIDVTVAEADLGVAKSEERRLTAWLGYLTLTAPFDGVIVVRNANTFDFVLPATGDPTAARMSPDQSPGKAAPIYVVDRTDIVRVFVDIPEIDANFVRAGTVATVTAKAYSDSPIPAKVTRTAWALNVKSYTLRAEIDLPNPKGGLLPGMYAYAAVNIEHPGIRALPVAAIVPEGDEAFCFIYDNGKAKKVPIQTGVSDGDWVEVTNIGSPANANGSSTMTPVDGKEQVIIGELSTLADGSSVKVDDKPATDKIAAKGP